jgi:hypothetical protein
VKPIVEVSGIVAAPAGVVVDRMADYFDSWRGSPFPAVEIDRQGRTVAIQGGWWYRGEYTVDDHPGGSRVTHRVYNVATRLRWGVPLANRLFIGYRPKVEAGFQELLGRLR